MSYDNGNFIGKLINDFTKELFSKSLKKPLNNYESIYSEHNLLVCSIHIEFLDPRLVELHMSF